MTACRSTYARAVQVHERAARIHDEAAARARLAGDTALEAHEREFAEKERGAAQNARDREAATVGLLVALDL
jgi:hypothetical protein